MLGIIMTICEKCGEEWNLCYEKYCPECNKVKEENPLDPNNQQDVKDGEHGHK